MEGLFLQTLDILLQPWFWGIVIGLTITGSLISLPGKIQQLLFLARENNGRLKRIESDLAKLQEKLDS